MDTRGKQHLIKRSITKFYKRIFDALRDFDALPTQQESSDLSFRYLTGGHGGRDCAFGWTEA
jgi:hypothetical protein